MVEEIELSGQLKLATSGKLLFYREFEDKIEALWELNAGNGVS